MSFFVTSAKSTTGNLGGLRGADNLCQNLASAAGVGNKTWRAYLSVERDADNGNRPTDARSRIGNGPWLNAKGVVVANNLTELHARKGDSDRIRRRTGSADQRSVDRLAGARRARHHDRVDCRWNADGRVHLWRLDVRRDDGIGQVGHSDGLGPGGDTSGALSSWNSAHANQNCANTAPRGGAGRIYCFAAK